MAVVIGFIACFRSKKDTFICVIVRLNNALGTLALREPLARSGRRQ